MIMPAYTTLPESMLAPSQIYSKFNSQTLAGLGACGDCLVYDDDMNCVSTDTSGCDSTTVTIPPVTIPPVTIPSVPSVTMLEPSEDSCDAQGLTYDPSAGTCTYGTVSIPAGANLSNACSSYGLTLNSSTGLCTGTAAAAAKSSAGSTMSSAQQLQLDAGILKGGLTLAELLAIQPGQAILPNGTIVSGSGAAVAGGAASVAASLTSMMPMLIVGLVVVMMMRSGR